MKGDKGRQRLDAQDPGKGQKETKGEKTVRIPVKATHMKGDKRKQRQDAQEPGKAKGDKGRQDAHEGRQRETKGDIGRQRETRRPGTRQRPPT